MRSAQHEHQQRQHRDAGGFPTSGGGPGSGFQTAGFFMPLFPVDSETVYLKCTIPRTQSGWSSYISFYEIDVLTP